MRAKEKILLDIEAIIFDGEDCSDDYWEAKMDIYNKIENLLKGGKQKW